MSISETTCAQLMHTPENLTFLFLRENTSNFIKIERPYQLEVHDKHGVEHPPSIQHSLK